MLELKTKAAHLGIRSEEFPHVLLEDIVLGWDGLRLAQYQVAEPHIQNQLAQLSPISLAESAKEEDSSEDKVLAAEGAKIKARLEEGLRFSLMPDFLRASWLRKHRRWPGSEDVGAAKPIEGLDKQLAHELLQFLKSGKMGDDRGMGDPDSTYPSAWRVAERLEATKRRG